ncbi:MAG: ABC transporter substrate-binding protein [Pseudomonadota bacterium]|nr:MAG: ABC transporter substrate-binding protein [Pseudomonadota bacterium]
MNSKTVLRPVNRKQCLISVCAIISATLLLTTSALGESPVSASDKKASAAAQLRIVSLSPAISRTLVDFGLHKQIVGRTPFCRALDPVTPIVGDLNGVAYERLVRVRPTHVLVQPPTSGTDAKLAELAATHGWHLAQWPGLNTVQDIEQLIDQLPSVLFPEDSAQRLKATSRARELLTEIRMVLESQSAPIFNPRVLLLSGFEPVMAFGRETYLHDIATRLGAVNAIDATGWVVLSLEDVVRINPQVVILVAGSESGIGRSPGAALETLSRLKIDAARRGRITVLDHPDAMLPSSGVVGLATAMRELLTVMARGLSE